MSDEVKHERVSGGRFSDMSTADMAAQCRMQARENLNPEYTQFMNAVSDRLAGFAASKRDGAPAMDWQLAYAIAWANRSVESVKQHMWALEDGLTNLVASLADTGFHNSLEMAAARKLLRHEARIEVSTPPSLSRLHRTSGEGGE